MDYKLRDNMNHRQKQRMARRMRSHKEILNHAPIFQTRAWTERAENRQIRAKNRVAIVQAIKAEKLKVK